MKIGFSSFVLQGGRSGVATYIVNLLKALDGALGDDLMDVLVSRDEEELLPAATAKVRHVLSAPRVRRPIPNILWHNVVLPTLSRQRRYDLLHVPSYRRIPVRHACPLVATVHDLAAFYVEDKYDAARMFYNRRVVPALIRGCDRLITVSNFTRDDIVRIVGYPEDRIHVVYSGIDHELFRPQPEDAARALVREHYGLTEPYFIYVSRLEHPGKNHVNLISAFERFKDAAGSNHKLLLVGADWYDADAIREAAALCPYADDILFPGFVPRDHLPALYAACACMVFPSLFEGFGLPVLEAMACGAPVVCARTSSLTELATGHARLVDPHEPEDIADGIRDVLADPDGRRQDGIDHAATFRWEDTARQVVDIYRKVLDEA